MTKGWMKRAGFIHQSAIVEVEVFSVRFIVDSVSPSISYSGKALAGASPSEAVWQIKKIDETDGVILTWADGDADFDNVFDNRETLNYS